MGEGLQREFAAALATRKKSMLTIRLPRAEYELIRQAASLSGKSMNRWCLDVLLEAARRETAAAEGGS